MKRRNYYLLTRDGVSVHDTLSATDREVETLRYRSQWLILTSRGPEHREVAPVKGSNFPRKY